MSSLYKLSFDPIALKLHAKAKLHRCSVPSKVYVHHNGTLTSTEYANRNWTQITLERNIDVRGIYSIDSHGDGEPLFVVKTESGIRIYQQHGDEMKILLKTDDFEDENYFDDKYYDWDKPGSVLRLGYIYSDSSLVGIVGKRKNYGIRIFAIVKDKLQSSEYPINELNTNTDIFGDDIATADIALSDIENDGHDNIIVHGKSGLNIYSINDNLDVERQTQIPNTSKSDDSSQELFFPNLTGQSHRDIVVLNDTGLFVYQYTSQNSNYVMINYLMSFSKLIGWLPEHKETVQFEDIDLDGRQDMILTGPQGIMALTFDTNLHEWKPLLDNSELPPLQRRSDVVKVIGGSEFNSKYPWVMTKYKDRLYAAKIESIEEKLESHSIPATRMAYSSLNTNSTLTPVLPTIDVRTSQPEWSTILLQDQLDYSSIFQDIGNTGMPSFHLQLVDLSARLSKLRFDVIYEGINKISDVLGIGWSFPLSFITVISPTIFPEDDVFFLLLDGFRYQLTFKANASNGDVDVFEAASKSFRIDALYYKNKERWEIRSEHFTQVYGGLEEVGVSWSQKEEHMRNEPDEQYANVWRLVRSEDKHKNVLQYAYESTDALHENGKTIQEMYLKSVNDSNDNHIVFNYSGKNSSEYLSKNSNQRPTRSRYLSNYTITTSTYEQIIEFVYETNDGKRLLTSIQQLNDVSLQPVLQFAYAKVSDEYTMQTVTLPSRANIEFESKLRRTSASEQDANKKTCEVVGGKDYGVHNGGDYTIVSYLDGVGRAVLRIYSTDMTEELFSPLVYDPSKKLPLLGTGSANSHQIFTLQHFIAIILTYEKGQELHLLRRTDKKWVITPQTYKFNDTAVIRCGNDFIVVADVVNSVIETITWDSTAAKWAKYNAFDNVQISAESLIFMVSSRFIVNVQGNVLMIAYKDRYGQWHQNQILNIPNVMNDIMDILNRFGMKGEERDGMFKYLKSIALRVSDNLILLNRCTANGMQLHSEIYTIVLDSKYNALKRQTIKVKQDDLATFSKDLEVGKYIVEFVSGRIVCNKQHFVFAGGQWVEDAKASSRVQFDESNKSFSIPLAKKFVLSKTGADSSVKLHRYKNDVDKLGEMIVDLHARDLSEIVLQYPKYLAYTDNNSRVNVIVFSNDGNIVKIQKLPVGEILTKFGSPLTVVTGVGRNTIETLIFRHLFDIDRLSNNVVTTQTTTHLDNGTKRIMGYEYDKATGIAETMIYERIIRVPNNDKSTSGWIEETYNLKEGLALDKLVYNLNGELVRAMRADEKSTLEDDMNDEEARLMEKHLIETSTLLDRTGNLIIAHTFPHRWSDGDVSYIGFEDYENIGIGDSSSSANKWIFDVDKIVKNGFSFTGNNFLQLTNATLAAIFDLGTKNQLYMVSSWIRPQKRTFNLFQTVPYMTATIAIKGQNDSYSVVVAGEAKFTIGDWFYVEVVLDLHYARETLKATRKLDTKTVIAGEVDLVASIVVVPSKGVTFDVDHIRFAPLSNVFAVNVYDSKTYQLKAVVGASGLVERYIHDEHLSRIATINEYGELKTLETYTKASSVGRLSQLKSKVTIQPETGFYEQFEIDSFVDRWRIENNDAWHISPGQLKHAANSEDTINLSSELLRKSMGVRISYHLQSMDAFIQFNTDLRLIYKIGNIGTAVFLNEERPIPTDGEILIVAEGKRSFVWIDGGLYFDTVLENVEFNMKMTIGGLTSIGDVIVFYNPSVTVSYINTFDEQVQRITLESENVSSVIGCRYDALGREIIVTRPIRIGNASQKLLDYHTNVIASAQEYIETRYCNSPLNDKCTITHLSSESSVSSPHAKRYSYSSDDLFIKNLYPVDQNYVYRVEYKGGNVTITTVFDNNNNRVAWYLRAPKGKSLLGTYKYDKNGKVTQMLPPAYHTKVNTFHKITDRLHSNASQDETEKTLQKALGVNTVYDEDGHVLEKSTPDSGTTENIYNEKGMLAFVLHFSNGKIKKILYHEYDVLDRLRSSGELTDVSDVRKEYLLSLKLNSGNSKILQQFHYNDYEQDPMLRGKILRSTTFNHGEQFVEEYRFDIDEELITKRVNVQDVNQPDINAIDKIYRGGKLRKILYPILVDGEPFTVTYEYDKVGNVNGIGVPGNRRKFLGITYNPDGQINAETYEPWSVNKFTRRYSYNSAGFLTNISDPFLAENLYYTDGYGSKGYSDGMITRTEYKAIWSDNNILLGLNESSFVGDGITPTVSSVCFNELNRSGYLNEHGRQIKTFYPKLEVEMPILCTLGASGRRIQNVLGKWGFATQYGHSYDYGNYRELAKAKYFVGNVVPVPLQADSFAQEIRGIDETVSHDIWKRLTSLKYLIDDNSLGDLRCGHGKQGKSFINSALHEDLKNLGDDYKLLGLPLENLLMAYFAENRTDLTQETLAKWNIDAKSEKSTHIANKTVQMLRDRGYMNDPLDREFASILKPYQSFIRDIVRVLFQHFSSALGESEFDTESYDIDENGNHRLFYTGFDRHKLSYNDHTNQIDSIIIGSSNVEPQVYAMKHDHRGNVIQALHRGIQRIDYNPISNRASKIQLVNGKTIAFYYDARGERVAKKVFDSTGQTTKEIHYTRDELGRALVERQLTYIRPDSQPDVLITAYIYGPSGLIGVIRRGQFYGVLKDHDGSTRAVTRDNEVVAAYDYLPYGSLMRQYLNDGNACISYGYTGQEWDEEIGLYNYHARFYDPSIGRFYQIDPAEQYFSPYKYAGNSPVMMVDPDGKIAIIALTALALALVGAYLGGAAANDEFNPVDWKWKNKNTWLGIVGGALTGALLPLGAVGSATVLINLGLVQACIVVGALGIAGAYLSMGAAYNSWDPRDWNFSSPILWNAMFDGFAIGASIPAGINHKAFSTKLGKFLFVGATAIVGTGSFVFNGIQNNWDFTTPGMYLGFLIVFNDATTLPTFFRNSAKSFSKIVPKIRHSTGAAMFKVVVKFASKGIGLIGPSLLLTYIYGEMELGCPAMTFAIIRQMSIVNLHYSILKDMRMKWKRNYKILNEEWVNDELLDRVAEMAQESRSRAVDELKELEIGKNRYFMSKSDVSAPSALAVAASKHSAVATFSGNENKGFVFIYKLVNSEQTEHIIRQIDGFLLKKNNYIVKDQNTITILDAHDGSGRDRIVERHDNSVANFERIKIHKDSNLRFHPDEAKNLAIKEDIDRTYAKREEATFNAFLNEPEHGEHAGRFTSNDLESIRNKIVKNVNSEMNIGGIEKAMTTVFKEARIDDGVTEAYRIYRKNYYKKMNYPPYPATNCAEVHAITASEMLEEPITRVKAYKVPKDGEKLEYFPPCVNCIMTTKSYYQKPEKPSRERGGHRRGRSIRYDPNRKVTEMIPTGLVSHCTKKLNNIYGWIGQRAVKVGGLLTGWIDTTNNFKPRHAETSQSLDVSRIDQNGTILLFDVLIRKFTGRKYYNSANDDSNISEQDACGFAIEITAAFEEILDHELGGLDIDFSKIQKEIFHKIVNNKQNEIKSHLQMHIEKACKGKYERVRPRKYKNIMTAVDEKLSITIDPRVRHSSRC